MQKFDWVKLGKKDVATMAAPTFWMLFNIFY